MKFQAGQIVQFAGAKSVVRDSLEQDGRVKYHIESGDSKVPMWVPETVLVAHQNGQGVTAPFNVRTPDMIVVDNFYKNPDEIREIGLAQDYWSDLRHFKGERTKLRFLWPYLREEFGRLLGKEITEWLAYDANGIFQQTGYEDPLVWHCDNQQYAGAIYLTPDAPPSIGTSFWRDKTFGCRHLPSHADEVARLHTLEKVLEADAVVNAKYNIEHGDNWELIESIAGLYNRLVIWDAKLIHSATSYDFGVDKTDAKRLVQLFFFDAA